MSSIKNEENVVNSQQENNNAQRQESSRAANNAVPNNSVQNPPVRARSIWAPEIPRNDVRPADGMSTAERIRFAKFGN